VDQTGEVIQKTELSVPAILDAKIPIVDLPQSLVECWGDFFPKLTCALFLLGLTLRKIRSAFV
jgi:hypothetical protein